MSKRSPRFSKMIFAASVWVGLFAFGVVKATEPQEIVSKYEVVPTEGAPEQLSRFAPLIGRWKIEDWSKDKEGNWVESTGADWDFWFALDGWAVQDLWVQPGYDVELEDPTKRFVGTNVRVWNTAAEQWKMSWIYSPPGAPQNWIATSTPEEIDMEFTPPGAEQSARRIKFFNMTGDHFDWMMYTRGEDDAWVEAYKIRGVRKD